MVEFISKEGRKIEIREIQENDWVGLRNLMNSLVKENAFILRNVPISKEEQIKNLKKRIGDIKKEERVDLVAIYKGKLVANIYIRREKFKEKHVGTLGVFVKKNYRNEGIGKALMKEVLKRSKRIGIKLVVLEVFKVNKPAMILYKKLGFKSMGNSQKH